jgi:hypothetical protein
LMPHFARIGLWGYSLHSGNHKMLWHGKLWKEVL